MWFLIDFKKYDKLLLFAEILICSFLITTQNLYNKFCAFAIENHTIVNNDICLLVVI